MDIAINQQGAEGNRAVAMQLKRKNIDLPEETWRKFAVAAATQGKTVKAYVQNILLQLAENIQYNVQAQNPSPSGDSWFNDPKNVETVLKGAQEIKDGKGVSLSEEEIHNLLFG